MPSGIGTRNLPILVATPKPVGHSFIHISYQILFMMVNIWVKLGMTHGFFQQFSENKRLEWGGKLKLVLLAVHPCFDYYYYWVR